MSDKLDNWTIIAGCVALAAVLGLGLLANSAVNRDGWNRDDHPMTARTTMWFGHARH